MDGWQRIGGVDWLCVEPISGADVVDAGFVLPFGYAHETPADLGIAAAAATALVRELRRPRELPGGGVVELDVAAQVNLQDTVLRLVGSPDAVRLGLTTLDRVLADPAALDVSDLPVPRPSPWTGWTSELTAWFGMGPAVFSTEWDRPWAGEADRLRTVLSQLYPGRDPHQDRDPVAWTSDATLLGAALAERPDRPDRLPGTVQPLRWREPSPVADGPRSLISTFDNNLLSIRMPADRLDGLARNLLGQTLHRSLVEFQQLAAGIEMVAEQVGPDRLIAVRAVPTGSGYRREEAERALTEAMEAYAGLADAALSEELARVRRLESLDLELAPGGRAVDAFRDGRRLGRDEILHRYDELSELDLRRATDQLRERTLYGIGAADVPGPDRPSWTPSPVAEPTPAQWQRRARVKLSLGAGQRSRPRLAANRSALALTAPPVSTHGTGPHEPFRQAVDLTSIAVRVDAGPTVTTLIDREERRVSIVWPAFARTGPLRALVDAATPAEIRVAAPDSGALAKDVSAGLLRRGLGRGLMVLLVLLVVVLPVALVVVPAIREATTRYQQPVVVTVAPGQLITLANGSTVLLSDPSWGRVQLGSARTLLTAQVRYCGGGRTVDRSTGEDARNYVTPERFVVTGISRAAQSINDLSATRPALEATQLQQGQCTSGEIAFAVDGSGPAAGTLIRYRNGSGDDLTWRIG